MDPIDYPVSDPASSPPPKTAIDQSFTTYYSISPGKSCDMEYETFNLTETIRLQLSDGEEMIVERNRLCYYSNYFRCLFSSNFRDSRAPVHRIRLISATNLHILLTIPRALENGIKPEISLQKAIDLLEPAAYLQMDLMLDFISDIICDHLHYSNIVKLFHHSLLYYIPLSIRIWRRILVEFQSIYSSGEFLNFSEDELIALLCDKNLSLKSVDERQLIEKWVKSKTYEKSRNMRQFAEKNFARRPLPDGTRHEVIRNRQPSSGIVCFGGWCQRGVSQLVEVFNTRSERWQPCKFNYQVPSLKRAYHANEIVDNKLIVFGGFSGHDYYQTTLIFDLITKEGKLGKNMHDKRSYLAGASLIDSNGRKMIYACGGMNGTSRLRSVECYDYLEDVWTECGMMTLPRSDGAISTVGGRIIASGGFDGRSVHSSCEIYDPIADCWLTAGRQMRVRRTGCSSAAFMDNVCIVAGGFNGHKRLDSAELFDIREGIWHALPLMQCGRSNFGMIYSENYIYAAGGFDGQATTKENERFDLRARKWQALPDLNETKSALRLLQISDHPILDELFNIPEDFDIVKGWS
ncbi:unnamed protein product [Caenorhabditis bovis]|uniref:BTB domain-containing protein n=1 Tax=Caenorhabditis bovis TaxID=2654633 RepID=A0A8S1EZ29_9PELO|nr:unnamed protein product [Caenorhabditis bovis]